MKNKKATENTSATKPNQAFEVDMANFIGHPWVDVMLAVQNKYPNPYNNSVLNIDVLNRTVDRVSGILHSIRLVNSSFPMFPHLGQLKALELSSIDQSKKHMTTISHNIDIRGMMQAVELIEYIEHPENSDWTLLKHSISVNAFKLIAMSASTASRQAARQGRSALSWVIEHRLPVLHSFSTWHWNSNEPGASNLASDTLSTIEEACTGLTTAVSMAVAEATATREITPPSPRTSSTTPSLLWSSDENQLTTHTPALTSLTTVRPTLPFFADAPTAVDGALPQNFPTFSTMSDALLRRSQRVARLFSRIDEYVVIM